MADLTVVTGEENAGQELSVPVPGRASPLRLRFRTGGSGGSGAPLSTVLFADVGTAVAPADQNGCVLTPFGPLQDAINANPSGGTIMLTPGDYGVGLTLSDDAQFSGMAAQGASVPVLVSDITIDGGVAAWFENMTVAFTAGANAALEFFNCQAGGIFGDGTGTGSLFARLCQLGDVTGAGILFNAFRCQCGAVSADDATFTECSLTGNVTVVGTLRILNATHFDPGLTLTAANIEIDAESLRRAVFAGTTFVGTVSGFSGDVLYWGKLNAIIVGVFLPPGAARQNYTGMNTTEANTQIFAPRRGVLCFLIGLSTAQLKFTLRVNGVDTALTVTVNNSTVRDTTHFVEVQAGDLIGIAAQDGGNPAASGSALVSAVYV